MSGEEAGMYKCRSAGAVASCMLLPGLGIAFHNLYVRGSNPLPLKKDSSAGRATDKMGFESPPKKNRKAIGQANTWVFNKEVCRFNKWQP